MSKQPGSREALYERIRESSKDNVIYEEMVRLGFWPQNEPFPVGPKEEQDRIRELEKKLSALRTEKARLGNIEAMQKALKKKRMLESREKQKQNKERRLQEKEERKKAWEERKKHEILYLGEGYSAGLNNPDDNLEKLSQYNLTGYKGAKELAADLNISVNQLSFLAFARKVSQTTHYIRYRIPKKSGGYRLISAPLPLLKSVQYTILHNILKKIPLHDAAHGFRDDYSIVSNAKPHQNAEVVINMDLENFFPTLTYKRVKGMFFSLGYSEAAATIFALLCTEPDIEKISIDNQTYYIAKGFRYLPQGAPTSPVITNIICRVLDRKLTEAAATLGCTYTRYADDMTFSSREQNFDISKLMSQVNAIVKGQNFVINRKKTRVMRKCKRQEVTGIIVNEKLNISRQKLRNFRALLYQIEKDGPQGKEWGNSDNIFASIKGYANYVFMVNPEKGRDLLKKVKMLTAKYSD